MSRTEARELLMQMIFQMEAQNDPSTKKMASLLNGRKISERDRRYIIDTFDIMREHLEEIDRMIDEYSPKRNVKRIPKADLAILRLAICEGKYCDDIPAAVAINEAVNMAKKYGEENTAPFINGVAGKILND
ncbi:MAG: transcription antitermination factor NusB [Eubacteriaceae bacterium]|nr:transcription antitermination factor NusB [Eubacteriaceae bacterium]